MKRKTFRQELAELLRSFDEGEIDEARLTNLLVDFSPGLWPPAQTWDTFRLGVERWTGEKFLTARERGLTMREMQRNYQIPCPICHGASCALQGTPVGSFVSGAHIKR